MNCHDLGGSLVSVLNSFENTYISEIASTSQSYWIGLNLLMSSQWSWADGSNVTFFNWAPGQPADPSIYQCGALTNVNANNQWTSVFFQIFEKSLGRSSAAPRSLTCARLTRIIFHAGKRRLLPQPLLLGQFHALVRMFPPSCTCEFSAGTCPDPSYTLYADSCKCYKLRSFCFGRDSLAQKPWDQALQCLHSQPFWRSFQRLPF